MGGVPEATGALLGAGFGFGSEFGFGLDLTTGLLDDGGRSESDCEHLRMSPVSLSDSSSDVSTNSDDLTRFSGGFVLDDKDDATDLRFGDLRLGMGSSSESDRESADPFRHRRRHCRCQQHGGN